MVAAVLVQLERHDRHPGAGKGRSPTPPSSSAPANRSVHLYLGGRDQCLCKLIVRVGLSGATIRALVPRAPNVDLCPGRLATTDAQEEVAPASAHTGSGRRRDGSWDTTGQDHG